MKANNMIAGLACVLSISVLYCASESSVNKRIICETASGVFSVLNEDEGCCVTYQRWSEKNYGATVGSGAIAVLATGGAAAIAARALAAQFPSKAYEYNSFEDYRFVLSRLIDSLNAFFTMNAYTSLGPSTPNITTMAVLLEVQKAPEGLFGGSHAIFGGCAKNGPDEAAIIPQLKEFKQIRIGRDIIKMPLTSDTDAPVLCWEPKEKEEV